MPADPWNPLLAQGHWASFCPGSKSGPQRKTRAFCLHLSKRQLLSRGHGHKLCCLGGGKEEKRTEELTQFNSRIPSSGARIKIPFSLSFISRACSARQRQWKARAPGQGWMDEAVSKQWVILVSLHYDTLKDGDIRDFYGLFSDPKLLIHAQVPLFCFASTNSVKC